MNLDIPFVEFLRIPHYSGGRLDSYSKALIQLLDLPLDRCEVVDVDYIELTVEPITDAARLISEHSMTPYWVELRRREALLKAYAHMERKIIAILRDFHAKVWIIPRGIGIRPYRWEYVAQYNITESFDDFEETVYHDLEEFEKIAAPNLSDLCTLFGLDDTEVEHERKATADLTRLSNVRSAFEADLNRIINPNFGTEDDLPF